MSVRKSPVLIVGAGFAGLTAAALLAWRGIPCLVVDRRIGPNKHPRAHGLGQRSMELLRVIPGLEADLCAGARADIDDSTIMIAESVTGRVVRTIASPGSFDWRAWSPAKPCTAGQDLVEPILLKHARALGATVEFGVDLTEHYQDADGVRAKLHNVATGEATEFAADYLIGADGSGSGIRKALGITMEGLGTLSHAVSILFWAHDLPSVLPTRGFLLCYVQNGQQTGAFVTTDDARVGQLNIEYDPELHDPSEFDRARCTELVRAALGTPNLDVEVTDVLPWRMSADVAETMSKGRVFLAGDAAHIMPPVGGLAGQTAMQDGADLAWKLSMVIRGQAGRGLLDTYDTERRPVARMTAARLAANYVERVRPDRKDVPGVPRAMDNLSVALGYRYHSGAIVTDSDDDLSEVEDVRHPTGRPGSKIPHVWFTRDGETLSSLDLLGDALILLAAAGGTTWVDAAREERRRIDAPLEAYEIGLDFVDRDNVFLSKCGLESGGALLIRPDGFVAWRSRVIAADPATALRTALAQALCFERADEQRAA